MRNTTKLWWKISNMSNPDERYLHQINEEKFHVYGQEVSKLSRCQFFPASSKI